MQSSRSELSNNLQEFFQSLYVYGKLPVGMPLKCLRSVFNWGSARERDRAWLRDVSFTG